MLILAAGLVAIGLVVRLLAWARANAETNQLSASPSQPSAPYLVRDIAAQPLGLFISDAQGAVAGINGLYFSANDRLHGYELWFSDGTLTGTHLVRDINPGEASSLVESLAPAPDGLLFFINNTLWKSDGTISATLPIRTVDGDWGGYSNWFADQLIFFVYASGRYELWQSDGSYTGTQRIKLLTEWPYADVFGNWPAGNLILFRLTDETHGTDLWRSDGTFTGTFAIDLAPGPASAWPWDPLAVGGTIYVPGQYPGGVFGLWVTDGTPDNVQRLVDDLNQIGPLVAFNQRALFWANEDAHGSELWASDGCLTGTILLRDIYSGTQGSSRGENILLPGRGVLFFADDGLHGEDLWISDGTPAGTQLVKDLPGSTSISGAFLGRGADAVYFAVTDPLYGRELWITDGSLPGTRLVADIAPGAEDSSPQQAVLLGDLFIFAADNGSDGVELWRSDGSSGGTWLLKDIWPGGGSSQPSLLGKIGSYAIYQAGDGLHGRELWVTDGTPQGTRLLKDAVQATDEAAPESLIAYSGGILFAAEHQQTGRELWRSDGTLTGTQMLEVQAGPDGVGPREPFRLGEWFYFYTDHYFKRLRTDGSAQATSLVDAQPWMQPDAVWFGEQVVFHADIVYATGDEPYRYTPTSGELLLLQDISPGSVVYFEYEQICTSAPQDFVLLRGQVYFSALDGEANQYACSALHTHGRELWHTDGTPQGTVLFQDIFSGTGSSNPDGLVVFQDQLFFSADDGLHGRELWRTDGTPQGTSLFTDLNLTGSADPLDLLVWQGSLYFSAVDGIHGRQLWQLSSLSGVLTRLSGDGDAREFEVGSLRGGALGLFFILRDPLGERNVWFSDGTTEGLVQVSHLPVASGIDNLTIAGDWAFFTADDGNHGAELWAGDVHGAWMLSDLWPGSDSSWIANLTPWWAIDRWVIFFSADTPDYSRELWAVEVPAQPEQAWLPLLLHP